jgi:hypothetical protein
MGNVTFLNHYAVIHKIPGYDTNYMIWTTMNKVITCVLGIATTLERRASPEEHSDWCNRV